MGSILVHRTSRWAALHPAAWSLCQSVFILCFQMIPWPGHWELSIGSPEAGWPQLLVTLSPAASSSPSSECSPPHILPPCLALSHLPPPVYPSHGRLALCLCSLPCNSPACEPPLPSCPPHLCLCPLSHNPPPPRYLPHLLLLCLCPAAPHPTS